jgi:hypothetical protein
VLFALVHSAANVFRGAAWQTHSTGAIDLVWRYLACVFEMLPIGGAAQFGAAQARQAVAAALLDTVAGILHMHPDVLSVRVGTSSWREASCGRLADRADTYQHYQHSVELVITETMHGLQECLSVLAAAASGGAHWSAIEGGCTQGATQDVHDEGTGHGSGQPANARLAGLMTDNTLQFGNGQRTPELGSSLESTSMRRAMHDVSEAQRIVREALCRGSRLVVVSVDAGGGAGGAKVQAGGETGAAKRAGTGRAENQADGLYIAAHAPRKRAHADVCGDQVCSKSAVYRNGRKASVLRNGALVQQEMQTRVHNGIGVPLQSLSGLSCLIAEARPRHPVPGDASQLIWLLLCEHSLQECHTENNTTRGPKPEASSRPPLVQGLKRNEKPELLNSQTSSKGPAEALDLSRVHVDSLHALLELLESLPQSHINFLSLWAWRAMEEADSSKPCMADELASKPGPIPLSFVHRCENYTAPFRSVDMLLDASAQTKACRLHAEILSQFVASQGHAREADMDLCSSAMNSEGSAFGEPSLVQVTVAGGVLENALLRACDNPGNVTPAWEAKLEKLPACLQSKASMQAAGTARLMAAAWWLFVALSAMRALPSASEDIEPCSRPEVAARNASSSRTFCRSTWQAKPCLLAVLLALCVSSGPPTEHLSLRPYDRACSEIAGWGVRVGVSEDDLQRLRAELHAAERAVLDGEQAPCVEHKVRRAAASVCFVALHQLPFEQLAVALQAVSASDSHVTPVVRYVLAEVLLRLDAVNCMDAGARVALSHAIEDTVDHALRLMGANDVGAVPVVEHDENATAVAGEAVTVKTVHCCEPYEEPTAGASTLGAVPAVSEAPSQKRHKKQHTEFRRGGAMQQTQRTQEGLSWTGAIVPGKAEQPRHASKDAAAHSHALLSAALTHQQHLAQLQCSDVAAQGRAMLFAAFPLQQQHITQLQTHLRLHLGQLLCDAVPDVSTRHTAEPHTASTPFSGLSTPLTDSRPSTTEQRSGTTQCDRQLDETQTAISVGVAALRSACAALGVPPVISAVCVLRRLTLRVLWLLEKHFSVCVAASDAEALEFGPLLEVAVGALQVACCCVRDVQLHALACDLAETLRPLAFKALLGGRVSLAGLQRKDLACEAFDNREATAAVQSVEMPMRNLPPLQMQRSEQTAKHQQGIHNSHSGDKLVANSNGMLRGSRGLSSEVKSCSAYESESCATSLLVQLAWLCMTCRPLQVWLPSCIMLA